MKNYTDITILMDRSGSMASIKDAMESGLQEFVQQHQKNPSTRLTFVQFDDQDNQDVQFTARPITEVEKITLTPRGWTPLLDSLCKTIDNTGNRLRGMSSTDRPKLVLFLIVTDGAENYSKQYKREDVKRRIETQQKDYNWQFVYLGANQDAFAEAASFGIAKGHTLNYAGDGVHAYAAMQLLARSTSPMFAGEDACFTGFTAEDQKVATGTGTTPTAKP